PPPVNPPPPPAAIPAPTGLAATAVSATRINLTWTESATNETGFGVERCSGANCTNFAAIGTVAANTTTYGDSVGLVAATQYSYRVRAFNATDTSQFSATASATTTGVVASKSFVMVGAGEITSCASQGSMLTAKLIDSVIAKSPDAIVFTTGNNVADSTSATYANCFDPRWGKFLSRIRPAIGQRDYDKGPDAAFDYFGNNVGQRGQGWYSFNVGDNWHVVVLNTATWQWGGTMMTDPNSAQNQWLAADLAANQGRKCTIAIMNLRRYYSYGSFENMNVKNIWNTLHSNGVELVLSGYDKYYERWNPMDHDMHADPTAGVVQFTVGTGGRTLDNYASVWKPIDQVPNLAVRDASTWGVLKLTLNADSYEYEFIPTNTGGFTDKSAAPVACH
ncbi:MAG TPA: fibronectin type III domain-containing protein, partial [Mycobacterium sp.]|nr:fibronectin type III domain-containing protein [Mycobacterium sp.]